jgi:Tol biopolymer transport system component
VLTNEDGVESGTGWTRDGSGYYFNSVGAAHPGVRKVPRGGGHSEAVAPEGSRNGLESGSGTFYYWKRPTPDKTFVMMQRTAAGDVEAPLVPPADPMSTPMSAAAGFYYKSWGTDEVYFYEESTGRSTRVLGRIAKAFLKFTVSPDGLWLATDLPGETRVDLMMMEKLR